MALKPLMKSVKAAPFTLLDCYVAKSVKVATLSFNVPLDHRFPSLEYLPVVAKVVNKFTPGNPKHFDVDKDVRANREKMLLFLQGGPGFQTPTSSSDADPGFLAPLLQKGYTVVFLDQRGTGLSSYLDADAILRRGSPEEQLEYVKHFRADSIVFDSEAIRMSLIPENKWTLLGQSFGGFTSVSYMSMFPDSLKQVMLTGGLPPIGIKSVDEVYCKTYQRTTERNLAYYKAFPADRALVWNIVNHLNRNDVFLPNGGRLTVNRFRHLGLTFGGSGATLELHKLVVLMNAEISQRKEISYRTKMDLQNYLGFETNVFYFLFQEAIYCNGPGMSSRWAAHRESPAEFQTTQAQSEDSLFMFTGEMVFPDMTEDYVELKKLQPLAELVHANENWSVLYDKEKLKNSQVPVAAAIYLDDQYVDYELSKANSELFHYEKYITNGLFHNGLRASSGEVLEKLFDLLEYGDYK